MPKVVFRNEFWVDVAGLINSGALVQLKVGKTPRGYVVRGAKVVAPSAASHYAPRYPYSDEAPRVYGSGPMSKAEWRRVWKEWALSVIEAEEKGGK